MTQNPFTRAQRASHRRQTPPNSPLNCPTAPSSPIVVDDDDAYNASASPARETETSTPASATPEPARPGGTVSDCIFTIQWAELRHNNIKLVNPVYRPRNKRHVNTNFTPLLIYRFGADIQDENGKRWWVCKICHQAKRYWDGVYPSTSTTGAIFHMKKWHNIIVSRDGKNTIISKSLPGSPFEVAATRATTSSNAAASTTPFDHSQYKKDFVDWVIADNQTFRHACSPRLKKLLTAPHLAPESPASISKWVVDALPARHLRIEELLNQSQSKINISNDLWTGRNDHNYVGVVGHWISKFTAFSNTVILTL